LVKYAFAALVCWVGCPALAAPPVIVSTGPDSVALTVYRDPQRSEGGQLELDDLTGFGLVTEQRTLSLPAGESIIRFEAVVDSIWAESALVRGLPGILIEKNRDADVLSPGSLFDAYVGKQVLLVRTLPKTGLEARIPATLRSAHSGYVLETASGFEPLGCSGLPERLEFPDVPTTLAAKPTLSVRTRLDKPAQVTLTLAYLADNFDWAASYVARLDASGTQLALTGWITLANANSIALSNADLAVVAGTLNRNGEDRLSSEPPDAYAAARLCWPRQIIPPAPPPAPAPPPMAMARAMMADDGSELAEITVTASRIAQLEELGDFKLYRVPFATTIAANAQKQTQLLDEADVPFVRYYRIQMGRDDHVSADAMLRVRNRKVKGEGLGKAIPGGAVVVMQDNQFLGEDQVRDTSAQEDVDIRIGESADVRARVDDENDTIIISNATARAALVKLTIWDRDREIRAATPRFTRKDGDAFWSLTVPANSELRVWLRLNPKR
jgi:hypothetical protein